MAGTITAISVQKKNPNRLNIELDGEFAFGVNRLTAAWLHNGQFLTDEQISKLQSEDGDEQTYLAALHLISYRPRTRTELKKRLIQKGYETNRVEAVIEKMSEHGMVNDQVYAQNFAQDRATFKPRSQRMISAELHQKGIVGEEIEQALQQIASDEELAKLALRKVIHRWESVDKKTFWNKCTAYLARKGFSYSTISEVIPLFWQETQGEKLIENG